MDVSETFDIKDYFKKIDVLDKGYVELFDGMFTHPMLKIVNAAKVSFHKQADSVGEKEEKLIRYLIEHEHTSPLRHSYFSFRVKVPLCVLRHWFRVPQHNCNYE